MSRAVMSRSTVLEMRLLVFLLLGFCCGIHCLKCRSQDGVSDSELKRIVRNCMQRSGSNQDDNDRRYGNGRYNFDNSYGSQDYGQGQGQGQGQRQQQQQQPYGNRWQRSVKQTDNNKVSHTGDMGGACVAQCFFEEMNMVDGNGQPDRRKVSYLLTKDLRDRELRNFYMDTVQQCFRYLEHSRYNSNNNNNSNNKCSQSRELIKCMSEYAKAQCDDWEEYGNMLFN